MSNTELNIIKELTGGSYKNSVITTFNASLPFYENIVLPRLWSSGIRNNLLVIDSNQYELALKTEFENISACGNLYTCDRVESAGAFHPKIILLTGPNGGKLFIGSGNTTLQGYTKNNELFSKFEYSSENRESLRLFKDVFAYLKTIAKGNLGTASHRRLDILEQSSPWLSLDAPQTQNSFMHNLEEPLLRQILRVIGPGTTKITVSAPYFDSGLMALKGLLDAFPDASVDLLVSNDSRSNFPYDQFISLEPRHQRTRLKLITANNRFYHAKYFLFEGKQRYQFVGSANVSQSALLLTSTHGNHEAGVLVAGNDLVPEDLWLGRTEDVINNTISQPKFSQIVALDDQSDANPIKISDAFIEGPFLFIAYSSDNDGDLSIEVNDKLHVGEVEKQDGKLRLTNFPSDMVVKVRLIIRDIASNSVIANNNQFRLFEEVPSVTKDVRSIYSILLDDSERIYSIFAFSPNLTLRHGTAAAIGPSRADRIDTDEEIAVLSPDKFYVEEDKDYLSRYYTDTEIHSMRADNESILSFLSIVSSSIKEIHKPRIEHVTNIHEVGTAISKQVDYNAKFQSTIKSKISRIIENTQAVPLHYIETTNLMSTLAVLVVCNKGLPTKDMTVPLLKISHNNYVSYSLAILSRLYLDCQPDDLMLSANDADKRVINDSMIHILALSVTMDILKKISREVEYYDNLSTLVSKLTSIAITCADYISNSQGIRDRDAAKAIESLFGEIPSVASVDIVHLPDDTFSKKLNEIFQHNCTEHIAVIKDRLGLLNEKRIDCIRNPGAYSVLEKMELSGRSFDVLSERLDRLEASKAEFTIQSNSSHVTPGPNA